MIRNPDILVSSKFEIRKMADDQSKIQRITDAIGTFPDFPKPGILFK